MLGAPYGLGQDTVVIDVFRMYVSHCQRVSEGNHGGDRGAVRGGVHLVDAEVPGSGWVMCPGEGDTDDAKRAQTVEDLSFLLGLDSVVCEGGVMSGHLDPMHGMYWTWHSGYIFWKLEGHSTLGDGRDGAFAWHVGGFRAPFSSQRELVLSRGSSETGGPNGACAVVVDVEGLVSKWASRADWEEWRHVMSPGMKAMALADWFQQSVSWE